MLTSSRCQNLNLIGLIRVIVRASAAESREWCKHERDRTEQHNHIMRGHFAPTKLKPGCRLHEKVMGWHSHSHACVYEKLIPILILALHWCDNREVSFT